MEKEGNRAWDITKKVIGIALILIGVMGMILPIIPGIIFILLGLFLLGNNKIKAWSVRIYKRLAKKLKLKKLKKDDKAILGIFMRYLVMLLFVLLAYFIYDMLTPLTVYASAYLLKLFYSVNIKGHLIILNRSFFIEIISACVAGSAYVLLFIINFSTPMKKKQRFYSVTFSFLVLFILNVLRIVFLSILAVNQFRFFDLTHKLFWYVLSTLFVVGIWFMSVEIFSVKEIPIYSDLKCFIKAIINKK